MGKYANVSQVPLSLAVFLASDTYDYDNRPNVISVTTLLKPLRQIILATRVPAGDHVVDLMAMLQSRMGQAIHDAVEQAWKTNYRTALKELGHPDRVIDRVIINPPEGQDLTDLIPVWIEHRSEKRVGKWIITGKFDFCGDGQLEDFKSTSTATVTTGRKDDDYAWQGSMYRWLNPTKITKEDILIQWVFTDWQKQRAMSDPSYPQQRHMQKRFWLHSIANTQAFVERKLALIEQYWDAPEADIPECNDDELWRGNPVYKYYKGGVVTTRSSKNFDTQAEANVHRASQGTGLVVEVKGLARACRYCAAFAACSQKDTLIAAGDLAL